MKTAEDDETDIQHNLILILRDRKELGEREKQRGRKNAFERRKEGMDSAKDGDGIFLQAIERVFLDERVIQTMFSAQHSACMELGFFLREYIQGLLVGEIFGE